jgi:dihydroorotase
MLTRRDFLLSSALLAGLPRPAAAVATRYDLLIKGGRVLDPSQKLDRLLDVGIKDGKIAAIRAGIPATEAAEILDAAGRLITPGLVDIHTHARPGELSPDRCLAGGVTTLVDAGSRGSSNIQDMIEVAAKAPNRVRALMNISRQGNNPDGELLDLANVDVNASQQAIRGHRNIIVGLKVRLS